MAQNKTTNELYKCLPPEIAGELQNYEERKSLPAGTHLITAGTPPEYLICISTGSVEVSVPGEDRSVRLGSAGQGRIFGLRALVSGELPDINVVCQEECSVTRISRSHFLDVLQRNPKMYFGIAQVLSGDLKMADAVLRQKAGPTRRNHEDA